MSSTTVIATNMLALTNMRNLGLQGNKRKKANQKISSGKKINTSADDAAGLSISKKMSAQIKSMEMESKNVDDTISLLETAEGSLTEVNNMLTRVRELTVQAANDTNKQEDRIKMAQEVDKLFIEIDDISTRTEFNEKKLNNGTFKDAFFQIGSNINQELNVSINNSFISSMGIDNVLNAFGISEKVNFSPSGVVTGENFQPENILTTQFEFKPNQNAKLKGFRLTITANVDGKETTYKIPASAFKPQNDDTNLGWGLAFGGRNNGDYIKPPDLNDMDKMYELFVNALKTDQNIVNDPNIKQFYKDFDINYTDDRRLEIIPKNGNEDTQFSFDIKVDLKYEGHTWNSAKRPQPREINLSSIDNYLVKFEPESIQKGETITICGKEFTKVDSSEYDPNNPYTFSTSEQLVQKLKDIGLETTFKENEILIRKINSKDDLAFEYEVKNEKVSNTGEQFSNAISSIDDALSNLTK